MPSSTEGQLIGSPSNFNRSDGSEDGRATPERVSLHRDDLEPVDSPPPTGKHRGRARDSSFHRSRSAPRVSRQDASMEPEPEARRGLWRSPPPSHGPWPLHQLLHGPPHGRPRSSPPSSPSPAAASQRRQVFVDPHTHLRPLAIPGPGFPALPPNAGTLPRPQQAAQGQDRRLHFHPYPSPFPRVRDLRREWATGAAMDRRASPSAPPPPPCPPENPPSHGDGSSSFVPARSDSSSPR